jgi:hypothetical protein
MSEMEGRPGGGTVRRRGMVPGGERQAGPVGRNPAEGV